MIEEYKPEGAFQGTVAILGIGLATAIMASITGHFSTVPFFLRW